MNNINIIGRIGKEIELKFLPTGSAIANFSIAVNQDYKKQDGTKVEKTSWFDITAFGKTAENVNKFFAKGSMIGITGELEQQTWEDQHKQKRSKVVIKLQSFTFIDKKQDNQSNNGQTNNNSYNAPQQQYQQPQQQGNQTNYNQPQGQATGQVTQHGQPIYQPQGNLPTIDIDNDEIPHFNQ